MSNKITEAILGSPEKTLTIGDIEITPFILENGTRVITQRSLYRTLGITRGGTTGAYKEIGGGARLVRFLDISKLTSLIDSDVRVALEKPMKFEYNKIVYYGYEATVLQKMIKVIAKAHIKNELPVKYNHIGIRADILNDSFMETGIIALIDEFTGYKYIQEKNAIEEILKKIIRREYAAWVKRFPIKFFEGICRLKGWKFERNKTQYPLAMGHIINDVVYKRLAPKVLEELKIKNPKNEKGIRPVKHHQWLTEEFGVPALAEHLIGVQSLIDANTEWRKFDSQLNRVFPLHNLKQLYLDFPQEN